VSARDGHQDFRYKPCLVRNGYWRYFRKVLEVAIDRVKGDAFGFDNVGNPSEPESCHCPECRAAFVAFLKKKYRTDTKQGRALATERFGFATLDHVAPPRFNRWNAMVACRVLHSPVFQEWLEFKCDNLARRFEEIWRFVKKRKPDMLIEYNVYGDFGCNNAWYSGIDMHRLLPWIEAFWNERAPHAPEFTRDGRMLHRVHPLKLAQTADAVVFDWHAGRTPEQRKLSLAEGLAFNGGHLSGFGYMLDFAGGNFPETDDFLAFRRAHDDLFVDTTSAAQVALVESARSLAYDSVGPHEAEVLAMGSLLAGHVPFDLALDLSDDTLARYAAVVLPDVTCMTDDEAQTVMDYVAQGGAVVVTDETSLYDGWRRRRREAALYPMMKQVSAFAPVGNVRIAATASIEARVVKGAAVVRGRFGEGRFVYLPRLEPFEPFVDVPSNWEIGTDLWHLPKNFRTFTDAVHWAAGKAVAVDVTGPKGLAAEVRRTSDGRRVVHLVNYRLGRPAAKVSLTVRGIDVSAARAWSPGTNAPRKLKRAKTASGFRVDVATVRRYVVVELA